MGRSGGSGQLARCSARGGARDAGSACGTHDDPAAAGGRSRRRQAAYPLPREGHRVLWQAGQYAQDAATRVRNAQPEIEAGRHPAGARPHQLPADRRVRAHAHAVGRVELQPGRRQRREGCAGCARRQAGRGRRVQAGRDGRPGAEGGVTCLPQPPAYPAGARQQRRQEDQAGGRGGRQSGDRLPAEAGRQGGGGRHGR